MCFSLHEIMEYGNTRIVKAVAGTCLTMITTASGFKTRTLYPFESEGGRESSKGHQGRYGANKMAFGILPEKYTSSQR